jgi:hypothetical protein
MIGSPIADARRNFHCYSVVMAGDGIDRQQIAWKDLIVVGPRADPHLLNCYGVILLNRLWPRLSA